MNNCPILLCDDHQIVLNGLRNLLEKYGLTIIGEAKNGEEAVAKAKELQPSIVIMDISMPTLNGVDAAKEILKSFPHIRIIIYTMHTVQPLLMKLRQAGVAGVVFKEEDPQQLLQAIEIVWRGGLAYGKHNHTLLMEENRAKDLEKNKNDPLKSLSPREVDIFKFLVSGSTVKAIAENLKISPKTVETHKYNIFNKLSVDSLVSLVKLAMQNNMT